MKLKSKGIASLTISFFLVNLIRKKIKLSYLDLDRVLVLLPLDLDLDLKLRIVSIQCIGK